MQYHKPHRLPPERYYNVWVFITICTQDRVHYFGKVLESGIEYSPAGELAGRAFAWLGKLRAELQVGHWVVMPDHVHALIRVARDMPLSPYGGLPQNPIGEAVMQFKSHMTNQARKCGIAIRWQTGYYDRILTSDRDYATAASYIMDNPRKWWEKYGNPMD